MKDFILAALPWVTVGICLAVLFADRARQSKKRKSDEEHEDNYLSEGMCIGMCMGVAVNAQYGMCIGMLIGMVFGMFVKKKGNK